MRTRPGPLCWVCGVLTATSVTLLAVDHCSPACCFLNVPILGPQALPAPSPSSPRPWPSWSLFDLGCPLLAGPALLGEVPERGLSPDAQGQEQVVLEEELRRT